jgi:hypothetical protein
MVLSGDIDARKAMKVRMSTVCNGCPAPPVVAEMAATKM